MRDFFVDAHDGIRLAARDHGGDGPELVLLHGAGSHLGGVGYLARHLRDFHVVSMDARWSGWSGDADTYDWGDLVRDVEAVRDAAGLTNPSVVGHSWGGMIAAHYGAAHPEAPAVVNLDGHGVARDPALFDGLSPDEVVTALADLDELRQTEIGASIRTGDEAWYRQQAETMAAQLGASGLKPALVEEFVARSFADHGDGTFSARPAPTLLEGLVGDLGLFDLYRRVRCPLLVLDTPKATSLGQAHLDAHFLAYRRGLTKALDALAAEVPTLTVVHLPHVDHQSIAAQDAPEVAEVVRRFVQSASASASASEDTR